MSYYDDDSPFWRYFRDKLAFGPIAAPGALAALVHGLARYLDAVRADILWLRDQFIPDAAEERHIPLHGDSRGVPRIRYDTGALYRTRVERAAAWHKLGGKEAGLPVIFRDYGFESAKILNRRHVDPARWAHFSVDLIKPPPDFSGRDVEAVIALANLYKPARSVVGGIRFATQGRAALYAAATSHAVATVDVYAAAPVPAPPLPVAVHTGAAAHDLISSSLWVQK